MPLFCGKFSHLAESRCAGNSGMYERIQRARVRGRLGINGRLRSWGVAPKIETREISEGWEWMSTNKTTCDIFFLTYWLSTFPKYLQRVHHIVRARDRGNAVVCDCSYGKTVLQGRENSRQGRENSRIITH